MHPADTHRRRTGSRHERDRRSGWLTGDLQSRDPGQIMTGTAAAGRARPWQAAGDTRGRKPFPGDRTGWPFAGYATHARYVCRPAQFIKFLPSPREQDLDAAIGQESGD
jgi:hypothetical protein